MGVTQTQPFRLLSTSQSHHQPTTALPAQGTEPEKAFHKRTSDGDFKIHPRMYPGMTCCLPAVPGPLLTHALNNQLPLLTSTRNFLPFEWL